MYCAGTVRGTVAVKGTSTVRGTVTSRIGPCDSDRAGSGASSNDCDGGSRFRSGLRRRLAAFARAASGGGILLLLVAGLFALALPFAGPAAAQEVVEVPRGWPLKPSGLSAEPEGIPPALRHLDRAVTPTRRTSPTTTASCRAAPPPGIRRSSSPPRSSGFSPAPHR